MKPKPANKIRSVMVGGQRFKVVWLDISKTPDKGNWGYCDMDARTICLDISLVKDRRGALSVLAHELAHAFLEVAGYRHFDSFSQLEEGIVRAIENVYVPALLDAEKRL